MKAPVKQLVCIGLLAICILTLATACGPDEAETDPALLTDQVKRAAQEYQNHQNLDLARTQLNEIEVANSMQWLIYVTESALSEQADSRLTNALVSLALDLDLTSDSIQRYAAANGLLPEVLVAEKQPAPAQPALAQSAPTIASDNVRVVEAAHPEVPPVVTLATFPTTVAPSTAEPPATEASPTPEARPLALALDAINVRGGPGTNYTVVGALQSGEEMAVTAKNPTGDWWEVLLNSGQTGWVFGPLVNASNVEGIAVAANIPPPPPPTQPPPTQPPPATATPIPPTAAPPIVEEPPVPEAPPVDTSNPYFTLTGRRLWGKQENDGCRGKHLLRIYVKDAGGNPLNGVVLKGVYIGEEIATGAQGKGDGIMEYDLHGSGEAFTVIRDADGREAGSDQAGGFTTRSLDIDKPTLIAAGYCSNDSDCDIFYSSYGCHGHHSYEATFVRNY